jgi:type IV pilus assembly protein PilV
MKRQAHGFTLIEVLVALVVLGIGMLGLGRLFLYTLQGNSSATSRTVAVNLAADLADRIRANRNATLNYNGARPITAVPTTVCVGGALSFTVLCTPQQTI